MKGRILYVSLVLTFANFSIFAQITSGAIAGMKSEMSVKNEEKFIAGIQDLQLGKLASAEEKFKAVYDADDKCDACAHYLSRVNAGMEKTQVALDWAKKSIAADPKNKWYSVWLAEMYEKQNQFKNAAEVYQKLISGPNFTTDYQPELYERLAECYQKQGDSGNAIKTLDALEKIDGLSESLCEKKFALYLELKDSKRAGEELKKLAAAHFNTTEFQLRAANYYEAIGDKVTAGAYFKRVIALDPKNSKAILAQTVLQGATNSQQSTTIPNELKTLFANPDIALKEKVNTFLPYLQRLADGETKLNAPCIDLGQALIMTHPKESQSYAVMGDVYFYSGDYKNASLQYNESILRNATNFGVWEHLLYIYKNLGAWDSILQKVDLIQDNFPNENLTYYFQAQALEKKARYKEANDALDQALLMSGNRVDSKSVLLAEKGFIASKQKDDAATDSYFSQALALTPKSAWVLLRYANALQNRNDAAQKKSAQLVAQVEETQSFAALQKDAAALEEYGDYLFRKGSLEKAQAVWEKAAKVAPASSGLNRKILEKKIE